jgi:hypothetical protein
MRRATEQTVCRIVVCPGLGQDYRTWLIWL